MQFVDTHSHMHESGYELDADQEVKNANEAGVKKIVCVGTSAKTSKQAIYFAQQHEGLFPSVGLHPHDAKLGRGECDILARLAESDEVIAIGECGLDYYYSHSSADDQEKVFRFQIELAQKHNLPMIFHVRDAFDDFFRIIDDFPGIRGVVHSFTSTKANLERAVEKGLYIGFNGIMTFTKDEAQLEALVACPAERILLETDAPFLTPVPKRGTVNTSTNVVLVAEFVANSRGVTLEQLAEVSTSNAHALFKF